MLLRNRDSQPNAKSSSVLLWLVPAINQNAEQQLALRWHSIHFQQFTQEVGQVMYKLPHCLAKCICYYQHGNPSTCCISMWKQVYRFQLPAKWTVFYNKLHALHCIHALGSTRQVPDYFSPWIWTCLCLTGQTYSVASFFMFNRE